MASTFLHTADWQIGKAFTDMEGDAGALLRTQRIQTVQRIAEVATQHQVDAVLVAGDVFDTNAVSGDTVRRVVNALRGFAGTWVLLPGNHDPALAESAWSQLQRIGLPANVVLALKREPIVIGEMLAVLPAPLERRHDATDVTDWFDAAETPPHLIRVGLAHGSIANRLPRPSEAPNTIADDRAETARLSYLALGDWHGALIEIAPRTCYSGTPEPDRFRDNDPGNLLRVMIDGPGAPPRVEKIPVGHYRWLTLEQTISSDADVTALDQQLGGMRDPASVVFHLELRGAIDFSTREDLDEVVARHRARFQVLRCIDGELVALPSDDDLDRIDRSGFVRATIDKLRARAADTGDPQRGIAAAALQRLYVEHLRLRT